MRNNSSKILISFAITIVMTILFVCNCGSSDESTSPKGIMKKAVNAMDALQSYRQISFELRVDNEYSDWSSVPTEEWILTVDTSWVSPDRDHIIWINDNGWHEHIVIGDDQWWRGETSHYSQLSWISSTESGTSTSKWTVQKIGEGFEVYADYDEIHMIGSEVVNGADCFHLHCTDDTNKVPDIDEITADFWISKNDCLFRQIVGTFSPQPDSSDYSEYFVTQWVDFNEPIEIKPPSTKGYDPSDLPFPEGTFYRGTPSYENIPTLITPGSTMHLNEGQYYVVTAGSSQFSDDHLSDLYARIYAKQADVLDVGSPNVESGTDNEQPIQNSPVNSASQNHD